MTKRKTNEQFLKDVYDQVGDEYTPLEPYKNNKTPILMRHNKCGCQWKITPNNFINGERCPKCSAKRVADKKRKTNSQFLKEVCNAVGDEYTALEPYKNADTPILMKHNKCGYQWRIAPSSFINQGTRCPKCAGVIHKTNDQFLKELYASVGNEYTALEPYQNARTPILMRHNKCGYTWKVSPINFIDNGTRCPKCSAKRAGHKQCKTNAQFIKEVYDRVGDEYTPLEPYKGNKTPILMKHNKCGYQWHVTPGAFLNGSTRCPKCAGKMHRTNAQFIKEVYDRVGDEYTPLEPYKNNKTPILMQHNKCGYKWYVMPQHFLNGSRCPKCAANHRKTNDQFLKELYDRVGNEYTPLEPYKNANTPIRIRHNKCGHVWRVRPSSLISIGQRCPYCNQSHGELFIEHYLKQHHLHYVAQKKFTDLRDKQLLSYDFFVNSKVLIEYQGRQHYQALDFFGGQATFAKQQKHDGMKKQYAKTHHYVLLAIPYTYDTQAAVNHYLNRHLSCMQH